MYIANFLAGILKNHSKVSGITVQDELRRLWKGDIIRKKTKKIVGYQEESLSKRAIFDRQHPMFVGFHPDFEKKSEVSKYQNNMTLVAMALEKYQWNAMVAGETDDLEESFFSRKLFLLTDTQKMDMAFKL